MGSSAGAVRAQLMAGVAALALGGQAAAQEAGGATDLGEVIVTAQKRAENVQDVPIAITALGGDYLERREVTSIGQLNSLAPNVKINTAPSNSTTAQIAIRGSVTINPAITWEPAVGLYLDGVYIAKGQGAIFDVADLERIEVLRGPQGTLYGRNALAGAINLVLRKPTGEFGGQVEASLGDYNYRRLKGIVDLPQAGIFSVKLAGQVQQRDGFIDVGPNPVPQAVLARPNSTDETKDLDNYGFLVQVRAEPTDRLTADYTFDYGDVDQSPDYAQLYRVNRNGDPRDLFDPNSPSYVAVGANFPLNLYTQTERQDRASLDADPMYERSRTEGHALTIAYDLGAAQVKSITAYRKLRWADSLDLDGTPLPVVQSNRSTRYSSFSQEFQLTGSAYDERLNYVTGLYYFHDDARSDNGLNILGGSTRTASSFGSRTTAWAAYGQADFSVTDRLTVTGGLRYTEEKKDIRRRQTVLAAPGVPPAALPLTTINLPYGGVPDARYHNLSPALSVSYEATEDLNLYARWARGFKSGGFNGETEVVRAPTADCPTGLIELCNPYAAEKVDSYEVGLKSRLLDRRLVLNLAAFWDEHKDLQLSIFQGGTTAASVVTNAGSARIRGLEAEAIFRPVSTLTINGSLAYLDLEYLTFIDAGVDVADNRAFPQSPRRTASLSVDWQVLDAGFGKLNLIGDLSYSSAYFTYPYPLRTPTPSAQNAYNTRSPGQTIVNARAVLSDLQVAGTEAEVSLWVKNLLDEDRPRNLLDFGPGFGGLTVAYFPDPRTYGVTVRSRF